MPRGGPDGGDGGRGGDVVLIADPDRRDLSRVPLQAALQGAQRRGRRRRRGRHGADGASVELQVPVGTQVFDARRRRSSPTLRTRRRASWSPGAAAGGRGNRHFATPARQTPRFAETGLPGDALELELRLKLLADAALVGLPNAGKSSLLTPDLERAAEGRGVPVHDAAARARHRRRARRAPAGRRRRPRA